MRHLKVKAVGEMTELRKAVEEAQTRQKASEEELIRVQEAISRASLKVGEGKGRRGGGGAKHSLLLLRMENSLNTNFARKETLSMFPLAAPVFRAEDFSTCHSYSRTHQYRELSFLTQEPTPSSSGLVCFS